MPQYSLDPPPPAPVAAHQKKPPWLALAGPDAALLHRLSTFHTASPLAGQCGCALVPGLKFSNEVPPTLVTQGWAGGSMRLGMVVLSERMQPNAPVSPE